jgi:hypothetical protein
MLSGVSFDPSVPKAVSKDNPAISVTYTSFLDRLRSAFGGMLTGLAIAIGSLIFLFWNEGRAVDGVKTTKEGVASFIG